MSLFKMDLLYIYLYHPAVPLKVYYVILQAGLAGRVNLITE